MNFRVGSGDAVETAGIRNPIIALLSLVFLSLWLIDDRVASGQTSRRQLRSDMADSEIPVVVEEKRRSATAKRPFPAHWGAPPAIQTRDLRPLPGGYGQGSSTLARWITTNMQRDSERTQVPRQPDGDGSIRIGGVLRQWHKVTLDVVGPFADERDVNPNPFVDYRLQIRFRHESGQPDYTVPGYFAADGQAADTSASAGTVWRTHLSPDKPGRWTWEVDFVKGTNSAIEHDVPVEPVRPAHGRSGAFVIEPTDKTGRDLRAEGRLQYVGRHYLRFAGSGRYFLKAGADAPETLLACQDFDGTVARKRRVPLKTWSPHLRDYVDGDPQWQEGKGKGLIGAINYLSSKGCNAFSFLTYNAGGDGDNVWPFVERDERLHYDCSKLDQWGIVFDHANARGMYLHFKLQETENDDLRTGKNAPPVTTALDDGKLGPARKLYCRELVARYAHLLALNWNLGEENTQSTAEQRAMADWIHELDPYDHHLVVHTFPDQQEQVYRPLLGNGTVLTGASLQNSHIRDTHRQTVYWVRESARAGRPWVVAFDESGSAAHGQPPDLGYDGFDGHDQTGQQTYTQHEVRRQTLWGVLMAGGAGVEYYFGYQYTQNDLLCEDWRSRDQSWDDCRRALEFFRDERIPFWEMQNADELVSNPEHDNRVYCFAKPDELYLVYLPHGEKAELDLAGVTGVFELTWFNPRVGGELRSIGESAISAGGKVAIDPRHESQGEDWLAVLRRRP